MTALTRRSLFGGLAGLLVAPAIVRASSIMAVKPLPVFFPIRLPQSTIDMLSEYQRIRNRLFSELLDEVMTPLPPRGLARMTAIEIIERQREKAPPSA